MRADCYTLKEVPLSWNIWFFPSHPVYIKYLKYFYIPAKTSILAKYYGCRCTYRLYTYYVLLRYVLCTYVVCTTYYYYYMNSIMYVHVWNAYNGLGITTIATIISNQSIYKNKINMAWAWDVYVCMCVCKFAVVFVIKRTQKINLIVCSGDPAAAAAKYQARVWCASKTFVSSFVPSSVTLSAWNFVMWLDGWMDGMDDMDTYTCWCNRANVSMNAASQPASREASQGKCSKRLRV